MSTQLTIVVQKLLVISILKNHTTLTTFQPMFIKYRMSKSDKILTFSEKNIVCAFVGCFCKFNIRAINVSNAFGQFVFSWINN